MTTANDYGLRLYAGCLALTVLAEAALSLAAHWAGLPPLDWLYVAVVLAACPLNALVLFLLIRVMGSTTKRGNTPRGP